MKTEYVEILSCKLLVDSFQQELILATAIWIRSFQFVQVHFIYQANKKSPKAHKLNYFFAIPIQISFSIAKTFDLFTKIFPSRKSFCSHMHTVPWAFVRQKVFRIYFIYYIFAVMFSAIHIRCIDVIGFSLCFTLFTSHIGYIKCNNKSKQLNIIV